MAIDMASVFAEKYKGNPRVLQAAVLGMSPEQNLDSYTALRALQLLRESSMAQMGRAANQPTQTPSLVAQAMSAPQMPMQQQMPQPPQMPQGGQGPAPQAASSGLGAMPAAMPQFGSGGIVAFAKGGLGEDEGNDEDDDEDDDEDGEGAVVIPSAAPASGAATSPIPKGVDPRTFLIERALHISNLAENLANQPTQVQTPEEAASERRRYIEEQQKLAGVNPIQEFLNKQQLTPAQIEQNRRQALGVALLKGAQAAVEPRGAGSSMRGLAAAAGEFGSSYGASLERDRAYNTARMREEAMLRDSERKERMGLHKEAVAAAAGAAKERQAALTARIAALRAAGVSTAQLAKALQPPKPPAPPKMAEQLAAAEIEYEKNPTPENESRVVALRRAALTLRTSDVGAARYDIGMAPTQGRIDAEINKGLQEFKWLDRAFRKAQRENNVELMNTLLAAEEKRLRSIFREPKTSPPPTIGTSANPIKLPD